MEQIFAIPLPQMGTVLPCLKQQRRIADAVELASAGTNVVAWHQRVNGAGTPACLHNCGRSAVPKTTKPEPKHKHQAGFQKQL